MKCSAQVYGGRDFFHCSRDAKEGSVFCAIHNPEYIREKKRKRNERWDAKLKAGNAYYERQKAIHTATDELTTEELRQLTPQMIRGLLR